MPGGPLLGIDWRWVVDASRRRRVRPSEPPRVVLLTPASQESYDVAVHRDGAADHSEPASDERRAAPDSSVSDEQHAARSRRRRQQVEHAYLLEVKLAACGVMLWMLWMRVIPSSVSLSAMLWPLYLFLLNAWRFPRKLPPRARAEEPMLSRLLSVWRTVMLVFTVLLPLAFALATPLVLGSDGGRAVLRIVASPIFLLAAQLLMDSTIADAPDLWVDTVAVLHPVGCNVLRLGPCWHCAAAMWALASTSVGVGRPLERWFLSSTALLTLANAVLWTANLFVFLLPFKLPQLRGTS